MINKEVIHRVEVYHRNIPACGDGCCTEHEQYIYFYNAAGKEVADVDDCYYYIDDMEDILKVFSTGYVFSPDCKFEEIW